MPLAQWKCRLPHDIGDMLDDTLTLFQCSHSPFADAGPDSQSTDGLLDNRKRMVNSLDCGGSVAKRTRQDEDTGSGTASAIVDFDPSCLVQAKDGTCKAPDSVRTYLEKHLKRCLSKEEREALYKAHPRPDLEVATTPKADKYMLDFLGAKFPKEYDSELTKLQSAVLACIRPLTAAWQELLEEGLGGEGSLMVPATEVLSVIQRSLCLIGNASEFISQARRSRILECVDKSWGKYAKEDYGSASTLFGEEFQATLTGKVEKDVALSKAVAIFNRNKKAKEEVHPSNRRGGHSRGRFFRWSPPARYGGRQGRNPQPYSYQSRSFREGEPGRGRRPFNNSQGQRFHEPKLPPAVQTTTHKKF